jgi:hypothetical protein
VELSIAVNGHATPLFLKSTEGSKPGFSATYLLLHDESKLIQPGKFYLTTV